MNKGTCSPDGKYCCKKGGSWCGQGEGTKFRGCTGVGNWHSEFVGTKLNSDGDEIDIRIGCTGDEKTGGRKSRRHRRKSRKSRKGRKSRRH